MKKQRQRRRPASTSKGGSPRKPRAAPRPERGGTSAEKPVAVGTGASSSRTDARSPGAPVRPRWDSRNRVLLIGLFTFAAIAFVTAITVGVMVDLKEHGRTRLEALVGVGPSHAQGAP